ncbi:hypothetical protein [Bradyrhizobium australiense]|uniref:hypothetical protein n=1 Tax=Bradyrhizobium australiense TaxID=2721161 RepID=UPI0014928F49
MQNVWASIAPSSGAWSEAATDGDRPSVFLDPEIAEHLLNQFVRAAADLEDDMQFGKRRPLRDVDDAPLEHLGNDVEDGNPWSRLIWFEMIPRMRAQGLSAGKSSLRPRRPPCATDGRASLRNPHSADRRVTLPPAGPGRALDDVFLLRLIEIVAISDPGLQQRIAFSRRERRGIVGLLEIAHGSFHKVALLDLVGIYASMRASKLASLVAWASSFMM